MSLSSSPQQQRRSQMASGAAFREDSQGPAARGPERPASPPTTLLPLRTAFPAHSPARTNPASAGALQGAERAPKRDRVECCEGIIARDRDTAVLRETAAGGGHSRRGPATQHSCGRGRSPWPCCLEPRREAGRMLGTKSPASIKKDRRMEPERQRPSRMFSLLFCKLLLPEQPGSLL